MLEDEDSTAEHLHVLLTSPSLAGEVVTACICTRRRWSETLVIVPAGAHPFVTHESVVPYRYSAIRQCAAIEHAIRTGTARPKEKASDELVARMIAGLIDSEFTPPYVRSYFIAVTQS